MLQRLVGLFSLAAFALLQVLLAARGLAETGCPEPVRQVDHDVRAQIQGQLSTIGRLGTGQIEARTERTVHELLSKYPNADRVAITQNLISVFCDQLRQSRTLSEDEKFELFFKMQDRIEQMLVPDHGLIEIPSVAKRKPPGFVQQ